MSPACSALTCLEENEKEVPRHVVCTGQTRVSSRGCRLPGSWYILCKEAQERFIWCPLVRVVRARSSAERLCLPGRKAWQRCSYDTGKSVTKSAPALNESPCITTPTQVIHTAASSAAVTTPPRSAQSYANHLSGITVVTTWHRATRQPPRQAAQDPQKSTRVLYTLLLPAFHLQAIRRGQSRGECHTWSIEGR